MVRGEFSNVDLRQGLATFKGLLAFFNFLQELGGLVLEVLRDFL